jgi:hypothetical protein
MHDVEKEWDPAEGNEEPGDRPVHPLEQGQRGDRGAQGHANLSQRLGVAIVRESR